ncbi:MAG: right-handed parallel beta-helix repeat-containing protein [Melioribacteraceae bacterium]|nr:right-handed parallel beta-helix repeat-containing protein [Melioribacteraceae bacterium]
MTLNPLKKIFLFIVLAGFTAVGCKTENTENKWTPKILDKELQQKHFLPDYSFAGYKWGEESIPDFKGVIINIADFGAVPNDKKDDTEAIYSALSAANKVEGSVVLFFPIGRFILKDILYIERSNIVLRGSVADGKNATILYMPLALNELPTPKNMSELQEYLLKNNKRQIEKERGINEPFSLYAWSGGYIWTNYPGARAKSYMSEYNEPRNVLAKIVEGKRGENHFLVKNSSSLKTGAIVRINWFNTEGENSSLINYLYDNQELKIGSRHWETPDIPLTKQEVSIVGIEGNKIIIKEPLLNDLRAEWNPDVSEWKYISNVGIENLNLEFLYQEYVAHHVEDGYNGIYLTNTTHSWIKNVNFRNGDSGILTDMCSNVTIENVKTFGRKYHYAVHFGDCYNMLAKNLYIQAPVVHSLTFNTGSRSCVYTDCVVTEMPTLDQHSGLNYQNLFDNCLLYVDDPVQKLITMGGAKYWLPSHAAFSTFWNVRFNFLFENNSMDTIKITGVTDSPSERLIGITANYPIDIFYPINTYSEGINKTNIEVESLYSYQLEKRLNRNK